MDSGSTSSVELVTQAWRAQMVNHVVVASMAVFIYDYCLTLVDEVHLIWNNKFSLMKILYFLSRYPTFVDVILTVYADITTHIPMNYCLPINNAISWLTLFGISIAELILVFRTFALWARSKKVLFGLLSLLTVLFIPSLVITGIFLHGITAIPPLYPSFTGCNFTGGTSIIFFNFVMLILFETVIVGMTTFRVYRDFRGTTNPLISTLHRDGVMFFFCLFFISLSNVFVLSLGPNEFQGLIITFQRAMHSILSCRIIIHARRTDRKLNVVKPPITVQLGEGDIFTTEMVEPDFSVVLHHTRVISA